MLNNVPAGINRSARLVTLRHPNSMEATLYRKVVKRAADSTPASMGGMPTIGGLGVLDSEDEADYEYQELGEAKVVFIGQFQAPTNNMVDADNGLNYADAPIEALVECVVEPTDPAYFTPDSRDMLMVMPGGGFAIAYEIAGVTGNVNIPPYTRRYLLTARQDADVGV